MLALETARLAFHLGVELSKEALQGAVMQHETKALSSSNQQVGLLSLDLASGKLPRCKYLMLTFMSVLSSLLYHYKKIASKTTKNQQLPVVMHNFSG